MPKKPLSEPVASPVASPAIPLPALLLGVAGLIPFFAAGLAVWTPLLAEWRGIAGTFGITYGAIILSFLGGVRWGAAMQSGTNARPLARPLSLSVTPALLAYAVLILPALPSAPLLLAVFHMIQGVDDIRAARAGDLPDWYAPLRAGLTIGASAALLSLFVFYAKAQV